MLFFIFLFLPVVLLSETVQTDLHYACATLYHRRVAQSYRQNTFHPYRWIPRCQRLLKGYAPQFPEKELWNDGDIRHYLVTGLKVGAVRAAEGMACYIRGDSHVPRRCEEKVLEIVDCNVQKDFRVWQKKEATQPVLLLLHKMAHTNFLTPFLASMKEYAETDQDAAIIQTLFILHDEKALRKEHIEVLSSGIDALNPCALWAAAVIISSTTTERKIFEGGMRMLEYAAAQGFAPAQHLLGTAYIYGFFGANKEKKGLYWLEEAARVGNLAAQITLIDIYNGWMHVPHHPAKRIAWCYLAMQSGAKVALMQCEKLKKWYGSGLYQQGVTMAHSIQQYDGYMPHQPIIQSNSVT